MCNFVTKLSSIVLLSFFLSFAASAQTPTVITGADPLDGSLNQVFNGSFEEPHLEMGAILFGVIAGIDGDGYYWLSAITDRGPEKAVPDGWSTAGGGNDTYARWGNNLEAFGPFPESGQAFSSLGIDGERSVYLGNFTPISISETPAFMSDGEVVFTNPPTIVLSTPMNPGPNPMICCYGPDPFEISQTVTGLIPGRLYRMSFWVTGEWSNEDYAASIGTVAGDGMMAVDVEGYDRLYLAIPAGFAPEPPGVPHVFGTDEAHVYTLEFLANDTDMDISFINWGHFGEDTIGWTRGNATEAIIDDVIINIVNVILDVTIEGEGDGGVVSTNPGIDCSSTGATDCDETYELNTQVTLTATPEPGSFFVGWSGDAVCIGPDPTDPVLNLTMTMDISCIATFELLDFVLNPVFPALDDNINSISAEQAVANGNVVFLWGKLSGLFTVAGRVCNGIEIGIDKPRILAVEKANEFGVATYIFYIPLFNDLQFGTQLQAVDIETCRVSNQIEQIIRKDESG